MTYNPNLYLLVGKHREAINAAVLALLLLLSLLPCLYLGQRYSWWLPVLGLFVTFPLFFRYSHPRSALTVVVAAFALSLLLPFPMLPVWWAVPLTVFHLALYGRKRTRLLVLAGLLPASLLGALAVVRGLAASHFYRGQPSLEFVGFFSLALCLAFTTVAWFVGDSRRLRKARHAELVERTARLEYERDQERKLAALDERTRIAREMHDIVAHSLSVIIAQADGARYALVAQAGASQGVGAEALATISATARDSLGQMRQLLGILRTTEETEYAPTPDISQIPHLADSLVQSGFLVSYQGPEKPVENLPQGAELVAYRIVQEALTNIAKHARFTPLVEVELRDSPLALEISVENKPPHSPTQPLPGAKRGLAGMRERVEMYGGYLHYGPLPDGGFLVRASLPKKAN